MEKKTLYREQAYSSDLKHNGDVSSFPKFSSCLLLCIGEFFMCEGCKEIIVQKKPVIRQAAFKHRNDFVEVNELISIIHYKFLMESKTRRFN